MIRATLVALAAGAALAAFLIARPTPASTGVMRDFEAYDAAGAVWHDGGDPYGPDVWRMEKAVPGVIASRDELLPFVGPAFGLPLWSMLSQLPWNAALRVWQAVLVLALLVIALGSLSLGGGRVRALDVPAVVIVAVGFGPLTSGLALGQVAIVAIAGMVLAALALKRRRTGPALVAALVAGLQPNIAVALIVLLTTGAAWIVLPGAAFIALGGSALAGGGIASVSRYLNIVHAQMSAERFIAIQTTPGAVARALGASAHTAGHIALACALGVIIGIVGAWASRRYAPHERLALACAALPLGLPFAHEHDFTLAFLPAIMTVRRARGLLWTCAATAALLAGTDWLGLAQRPDAAAQTLLLTLAAALALAALVPGSLRLHHALPALLAFVVLGVSLVAVTHPLRIWPEAMGDFHVAAGLPAAAVWRLEQEHNGIARLDSVWGALRLLSLTGCALLWLTAGLALRRPSATSGGSSSLEPSSTVHRPPVEACPSC